MPRGWCHGCLQVGLKVLQDDPNAFKCWNNILEVIWHAELGGSLAILKAGEWVHLRHCAAAACPFAQ
jgi:hypothetical protein